MPGQVRTDTTQMAQVGRQAQDISQRIRAEAQAIATMSLDLTGGGGWEGQAARAARDVVVAQQARARRLVEVLDGHGDATTRGSTVLTAQEDTAAGQLRSVQGGIGQSINRT